MPVTAAEATTASSFVFDQVKEVGANIVGTVKSTVAKPINFAKKLRDGKLELAGFKADQLTKDLSAISELNTAPNSIVQGINNAVGNVAAVRKTISKHTGLDLDFGIETLGREFNDIVSFWSPVTSKKGLNDKFKNYIKSLKARIQAEMQECISKHLRALRNKIPALDIILDPELFLAKEIGKVRSMLQQKVDLARSKLLYKKIRIQKIAEFQKKILGSVRSLCPNASPTSVKKFQDSDVYRNIRVGESAKKAVADIKGTYDQTKNAISTVKGAAANPKQTVSNIANALENTS